MKAQGETGADLSPEAKNSKWFKELGKLTSDVEALVAEHCPRSKPLTADAYRTVASALMVKRARKSAGPTRQANAATHLRARQGAHKSATALLRHLKPLKQKLEAADVKTDEDQPPPAYFYAELELIEIAEKAVKALLPAIDRPPIAPLDDYEPIKSIANLVQEVLDAPTGKGEENPLVKLVVGLFGLVNIGYTHSTVSAVLRDRRRIKR
jgi:hypothetical protein